MCGSEITGESLDDLQIDFEIDIENGLGSIHVPFSEENKQTDSTDIEPGIHRTWLYQIIKPDKDGDHLISTAIILRKLDIALMLIDLIPDYKWLSRQNKMFQTALHIATLTNNSSIVRRLINAGINVSITDYNGNTALHIACLKGFKNIVRTLLTPVTYKETKLNSYEIPYQAIPQNLELRNADGLTCFLIAILKRNRDIIDLLIENEADINSFELKSGKTCLHILAEFGDDALIKHLLARPRINVNARTYSGYTALQIAIYRRHDEVAFLLRCSGADEVISDDDTSSD